MNEHESPEPSPNFSSRAEEAWSQTRDCTTSALKEGGELVRENPLPVVLGALAIGFVLGYLARSNREPTFQERYLDAPLEDLGRTLRALGDKTSNQAERGATVAAGWIHALAERVEGALER